ncbi:uncharacterized protein LOC125239983 [Leguminivora glycinivorella]|uniref:uncharacterized protein LOC125239983 n=1 Tax=Leguminivora glycinivorella TaxID=1035111 RepID=UPI00200F9A91|nr:uncharacterized protein LOC125239983 [Leguminivora glycinivorella]
MKKHKENLFSTKFRLLNSQEYSEEIIWSSSDSSEFEDVDNKANFNNITNKKLNRKRKRKSKVPSNVSNLDITIIDVNKDGEGGKSPVLTCKTKCKSIENVLDKTYSISRYVENSNNKTDLTSPVLCTGTQRANIIMKSPVIAQKYASPVHSPKVRKTLFSESKNDNTTQKDKRSTSPVLSHYFPRDRRNIQDNIKVEIENTQIIETQNSILGEDRLHSTESSKSSGNVELINKVKSFFDNQFSSENCSQVSIADTPTPHNISNDDVEIISITQMTSTESSVRTVKHTNSTDNSAIEAEKSKKIRYKKDGLAYRLCSLLKKNCANISLWQHERFLAENSNFKIPKGEHLVFRIQKVEFKYGSYLLDTMDINDEVFLILINNSYVNNCVFSVDSVFKLYEPYQIFSFGEKRLIVHVCKFECITIDL